eukprot:2897475-Pyramimonas_sp.AAC.1
MDLLTLMPWLGLHSAMWSKVIQDEMNSRGLKETKSGIGPWAFGGEDSPSALNEVKLKQAHRWLYAGKPNRKPLLKRPEPFNP